MAKPNRHLIFTRASFRWPLLLMAVLSATGICWAQDHCRRGQGPIPLANSSPANPKCLTVRDGRLSDFPGDFRLYFDRSARYNIILAGNQRDLSHPLIYQNFRLYEGHCLNPALPMQWQPDRVAFQSMVDNNQDLPFIQRLYLSYYDANHPFRCFAVEDRYRVPYFDTTAHTNVIKTVDLNESTTFEQLANELSQGFGAGYQVRWLAPQRRYRLRVDLQQIRTSAACAGFGAAVQIIGSRCHLTTAPTSSIHHLLRLEPFMVSIDQLQDLNQDDVTFCGERFSDDDTTPLVAYRDNPQNHFSRISARSHPEDCSEE